MTPQAMKSAIGVGIIGGFVFFLVILALIFATGQTFGQRCTAEGYEHRSAEWRECVSVKAQGVPT